MVNFMKQHSAKCEGGVRGGCEWSVFVGVARFSLDGVLIVAPFLLLKAFLLLVVAPCSFLLLLVVVVDVAHNKRKV